MKDLNRSLKQWAKCNPHSMATLQSPVAIEHAFRDAQQDVALLAAQRDALVRALRGLLGTAQKPDSCEDGATECHLATDIGCVRVALRALAKVQS